jgi:hypothetical protein
VWLCASEGWLGDVEGLAVGDVDVMEVCGEADAGGLVASMITLVTHTLALCTAAELGCRVRSGE